MGNKLRKLKEDTFNKKGDGGRRTSGENKDSTMQAVTDNCEKQPENNAEDRGQSTDNAAVSDNQQEVRVFNTRLINITIYIE